MKPQPEFSRTVRADTLSPAPRELSIGADEAERAALAKRFGLIAIERLTAEAWIKRNGEEIEAEGRLSAEVTQSCVASGAPVAARVDEPFTIIFRPHPQHVRDEEEEIELSGSDLDVVFYEGSAVDLGEAVAETLSLALDPYPRAPESEEILRKVGVKGEEEAAPAGALAGLKDLLEGKK